MTIEIWNQQSNVPVVRKNVRSTYTKGPLFCVMMEDGKVEKYPVMHLFRVVEIQ